MDGIVDLVADNEVKLSRGSSLKCGAICLYGGGFMLLGRDIGRAHVAGVVKPFAAFIKKQVVAENRLDITDKSVLADPPGFDELDKRNSPAVAERPAHQSEGGTGFAFAFARVDERDRLFGGGFLLHGV